MTLNGTMGVTTMIITAYHVCMKPTNPQGITAYHQQEIAFHRQRRLNTNPRYNFCHDLIKFIKLQQTRETRIILLGDFNQHIDTPNGAVHSIANACNLIDIWKRRHPTIPEPNTYLRGKTRIDYVLISPAIANSVQAIGYEPFHHTAATDHRGIFFDPATEQAFGSRTNNLESASQRTLQTKRHSAKVTYIRAAALHGKANNLFDRLHQLNQSEDRNDDLIERLDDILGQSCTTGENSCSRIRPGDWTTKIDKLRIWRRCLQKLLSAIRNDILPTLLPILHDTLAEANINTPLLTPSSLQNNYYPKHAPTLSSIALPKIHHEPTNLLRK
jgi:hypothetical protein